MTKKEIFTIAHAIKANFKSFADALRCAWLAAKIKAGKVARFAYTKKDGTVRTATVGTYDPSTLKGSERKAAVNQVCYFDSEANGWRSFLVENLLPGYAI